MNRDIVILPSRENHKIVIATDCTGACGEKPQDVVHVPVDISAYFTARVAFMELMSIRAAPVAYTISNFIESGYKDIHRGISRLLAELRLPQLPSITSSETNFNMIQSALAVSVIGTLSGAVVDDPQPLSFACIGEPLVGDEVLQTPEKMIQMDIFLDLVQDKKAISLLPVGSKGIAYELNHVYGVQSVAGDLDLKKSAGPATCLILGYLKPDEAHFINSLKDHFHPLDVIR